MKLFIIRHGEKENDEFNSNLTELGKYQAEKISRILKNTSVKKVYSSSNPRSIQTARIISELIKVPLYKIDSIKELPREIFFLPPSKWSDDYHMAIENIKKFIEEIKEKNEDVVLAMHAGINRAILSILLDIPLEKTIHFTQEVACLNILEYKEVYGQKRWCIQSLNSTYHLK